MLPVTHSVTRRPDRGDGGSLIDTDLTLSLLPRDLLLPRPLTPGSAADRRDVAALGIIEAIQPRGPRPRIIHADPRRASHLRARAVEQVQGTLGQIAAVRGSVDRERSAQLPGPIGELAPRRGD